MSTRSTLILTILLIMVTTAFSLAAYPHLPDLMASHWGANDQVNGYLPRFWSAFLTPLISLGMLVLFLLIPNIDPMKVNIAKFRETFNAFIVGPGWQGTVPRGLTQISSPIKAVLVIGRTLVENDSDIPTAYGLASQIQMTPLSQR